MKHPQLAPNMCKSSTKPWFLRGIARCFLGKMIKYEYDFVISCTPWQHRADMYYLHMSWAPNGDYPPVNKQFAMAMENGHRNSGLPHGTWWFFIANCSSLPGRVPSKLSVLLGLDEVKASPVLMTSCDVLMVIWIPVKSGAHWCSLAQFIGRLGLCWLMRINVDYQLRRLRSRLTISSLAIFQTIIWSSQEGLQVAWLWQAMTGQKHQ